MSAKRSTKADSFDAAPAAAPTDGLSPPKESRARVVLRQGKARPLWFGHPWVYGNAIEKVEGAADPGDIVTLVDHEGRLIGRGMYNPRSQIPVRLLTRQEEAIDVAFFRKRLVQARALRRRLALPGTGTNAYRLVNSEGDELPGVVIDMYGDAAVVQVSTLGMAQRRSALFDAIEAEFKVATIYEAAATSYAAVEGFVAQSRVVRGAARPLVPCTEDGLKMEVEPLGGQKTGLFLDQRANRIRIGQLSRGARVLDCYSYAGGFAMQAARGGASEVTAVDSSSRAVTRIEAHALANKLKVTAVEADTFRFLETATPQSYDLIIVDPPKFARARKDLEAARTGYERLNALAMGAAAPGALLMTCSCSQNVSLEDFERVVAAGAKQAGRPVKVLERSGPGGDHTLPPGFAEGQYLKVLLVAVA